MSERQISYFLKYILFDILKASCVVGLKEEPAKFYGFSCKIIGYFSTFLWRLRQSILSRWFLQQTWSFVYVYISTCSHADIKKTLNVFLEAVVHRGSSKWVFLKTHTPIYTHIYIHWKYRKTKVFLVLSGSIKWKQWGL